MLGEMLQQSRATMALRDHPDFVPRIEDVIQNFPGRTLFGSQRDPAREGGKENLHFKFVNRLGKKTITCNRPYGTASSQTMAVACGRR